MTDTPDLPDLAEFVKREIGEREPERVAYEAHISRASMYNILAGKRARTSTLEKLARAMGTGTKEQRRIYAGLMYYSGYLDLLPYELLSEVQALLNEDASRYVERDDEPNAGKPEDDEAG